MVVDVECEQVGRTSCCCRPRWAFYVRWFFHNSILLLRSTPVSGGAAERVVLPNFELDDRLEWDRADRDWDCRPELAHEVMELPP